MFVMVVIRQRIRRRRITIIETRRYNSESLYFIVMVGGCRFRVREKPPIATVPYLCRTI